MEQVYEQFFFLKYTGGWGYLEAYNLPVTLRVWFVQKLQKQLQMEAEEIKKASSHK